MRSLEHRKPWILEEPPHRDLQEASCRYVVTVKDCDVGRAQLLESSIDVAGLRALVIGAAHVADTGFLGKLLKIIATAIVEDVYVNGGITIQGFLRAGLIQRLIVTRVPVLIGEGISLFGVVARDIPLKHIATRQYASGLVQSEYEVG